MSVTSVAVERNQDVCEQLREAGINAVPYAKAPMNVGTFAIALNTQRNMLRIWSGQAKVTVLDTNDRQAVLRVSESSNRITRKMSVYWYSSTNLPDVDYLSRHFPVNTPSRTKFEAKNIERSTLRASRVTATVTAITPRSRRHFLVGQDERHLFICQLPRPCSSVKDAHRALKPAEAKRRSGVIRQGEFFLVPATKAEVKRITHGDFVARGTSLKARGRESDHIATASVTVDNRQFVTGGIKHSRHNTVVLNGWYKVCANREVATTNMNNASWD